MKLSLKLITLVGSARANTERKLFIQVIHELEARDSDPVLGRSVVPGFG